MPLSSSAGTAKRTSFVVDASALLKVVKEEEHSPAMRAWVLQAAQRDDLLAPHVLRYEVGALLARMSGFPPGLRRQLRDTLLVAIRFLDGDGAEEHAPPLSYYDASYLALAQTIGATLVTYDEVLAKKARAAGVAVLQPA